MKEPIEVLVERLLQFGKAQGLLQDEDTTPTRNALFEILNITGPEIVEGASIGQDPAALYPILNGILDDCEDKGLIDGTLTQRDLMDAKIMGALMPRASEINNKFFSLFRRSPEEATDYYYGLSKASNYIQTQRISRNLYWQAATEYGDLEITINLSKPEKDPKEIEKLKNIPHSGYPKCLLCKENEGFVGNLSHPARQNLRLIPVQLLGEQWYFQYSPYQYYNEHCILLNSEHVPMKMSGETFLRLKEFVLQYPHYFMGSNADLPIVGGSILNHDHFQGGRHVFPMALAEKKMEFSHCDFPQVNIAVLEWPMSAIRIESTEPGGRGNALCKLASHILHQWKGYSDEKAGIFSNTGDTPHNTVTPIMRINKNKNLECDIVLRNNRRDEAHPLGIFHPHNNLHHIKKENIGLIEVMGLAVLPGRLHGELSKIQSILTLKEGLSVLERDPELEKHKDWVQDLVKQYGCNNSNQQAEKIIQKETGLKFKQVLADSGVYKNTEAGNHGFARFMEHCGCRVKICS